MFLKGKKVVLGTLGSVWVMLHNAPMPRVTGVISNTCLLKKKKKETFKDTSWPKKDQQGAQEKILSTKI